MLRKVNGADSARLYDKFECAPPECYHTCTLYEPRQDRRCVRVQYGIYPNRAFSGLFGFGADVRFKRWAKLGTLLYPAMLSPRDHVFLQKIDTTASNLLNLVFRLSNPLNPSDLFKIRFHNPQRLLFKAYSYMREKLLQSLKHPVSSTDLDSFVLSCFSYGNEPFKMQVEFTGVSFKYRDSITLNPGANYTEIPVSKFGNFIPGSLVVYPENDLEARVVFSWLDFIKRKPVSPKKPHSLPAEKVKCVAWDLDNTMWNGILVEDGAENIIIPPEIISCIKQLDERGIVQTIVSKNNHQEAWSILQKHKLENFFIYPAINWAPKSSNLKSIAERINIGIDTFAFIDDSPFERAEVHASFPQVRIYSEKDIPGVLNYCEFDVPVTDTSKMRRHSYLSQMQREKVQEQFGDDYKSFLRGCQMHLTIFIPQEQNHIARCLELIQRSNQLNLSSRRYSEAQFKELLLTPSVLNLALQCKDRFGDYGIVGFASIKEQGENPGRQTLLSPAV